MDKEKIEQFGCDVTEMAAKRGLTVGEMAFSLLLLLQALQVTTEETSTIGGNA